MSGTEARGSTVRPMPLATMWRMVSSDEPSKVRCMPLPGDEKRAISGHTSSTWSRKQWPLPSRSMVSDFRSAAGIDLRAAHGWCFGMATTNGSSYSGCIDMPWSGSGSAMMAASSSPWRSSSSRRTVKFSCRISGICGTLLDDVLDQRRQQVRADGVDHAQAQRAGQRVLVLLGQFLDRGGLLQHALGLGDDLRAQRRHRDFRAAAFEQHHAKLVFELLDRDRQGRLGNVASLGGMAEMFRTRDGNDVFQFGQGHGRQCATHELRSAKNLYSTGKVSI